MDEEKTIREVLIDIQTAYDDLKQIIYKVFREPLTLLMNVVDKKLDQILNLPATKENFKLLKDFLNLKSK